nr:MAG TPA: Photosystem II protein D1 [Caudoviricetes sp.]
MNYQFRLNPALASEKILFALFLREPCVQS